MVRALLVRGLWVGLVAGLVVFGFALLFGEQPIDAAIGYEDRVSQAAGDHPEAEVVSRSVQATVGLAAATALYGVAFGGIFALVFAAVSGRMGRFGPRGTAALVSVLGFVALVLVPFLKYPANPPAGTDDASVSLRTMLYLVTVLISVGLTVMAVLLARRLAPRYGDWNSTVLAGVGFVVVIAAVLWVLPVVNETPADFPATVLYQFRMAALGTQAVLWASIGLLFGWLTERSLQRTRSATPVPS